MLIINVAERHTCWFIINQANASLEVSPSCHELSVNVMIQTSASLYGQRCPLKSLGYVAFAGSGHRMNRWREMLSQTFQPFLKHQKPA